MAGNTVSAPLVLAGEWEFEPLDANSLVIGQWLAMEERDGAQPADYAAVGLDTTGWLSMVPGAWTYQIPAEPDRPYPMTIWYRIPFTVDYPSAHLDLIIDGFAGETWELYVNGTAVTASPTRSTIDSQTKAVDIAPHVHRGENLIAVRLVITNAMPPMASSICSS